MSEQQFLDPQPAQASPQVSLDCVIFTVKTNQLSVLLAPASSAAADQFKLPTACIDMACDRNLEQALRRVISDQFLLEPTYLEQVKALGNHRLDARGWAVSIVYFSLINWHNLQSQAGNDQRLLAMPVTRLSGLSCEHCAIVRSAVKRFRNKAHYTSLPLYLISPEFTLSELQVMYEIILEKKLEKKSFRRRMQEAKLLHASEGMRYSGNRPAQLYQVKSNHVVHYFSRNLRGSYPLVPEGLLNG